MSFDPGGTTGVAIYDDSGIVDTNQWTMYELGPGPHHRELWIDLCNNRCKTIVYERFNYQRRDLAKGVSLVLDSKEYIGIIKLYADFESKITLAAQQPSERLFWTDDKLRHLGLWSSSPHERDAVRHLLYYVTFKLKDNRFLDKFKPE